MLDGKPEGEHCINCQHWRQFEGEDDPKYGICKAADLIYSLAHPISFQDEPGRLKTHAQFGCIQFDRKRGEANTSHLD